MWFSLNEDALIQELDDELIILNLATEQYHALNATARRFFELARSSDSRDVALDRIVAEFAIDPTVAAEDLDALINGLETRGVICLGGKA